MGEFRLASSILPPDTPWTPGNGISDLVVWCKGDAGVTNAGGGAVSQWADQSVNGNHLQQSTGAARPITGTRTINSINVIDFTPNQFLDIAADLALTSATIFVVLQSDSATSGRFVDGVPSQYGTGSGHRNLCYVNATSHNWTRFAGSTEVNSGIAATTSATQIVSEFSNSAGDKQYVNGTAGTAGNAGSNPLGVLRIGGDESKTLEMFNGVVGEIVVRRGIATPGERANWNTYCSRWGL